MSRYSSREKRSPYGHVSVYTNSYCDQLGEADVVDAVDEDAVFDGQVGECGGGGVAGVGEVAGGKVGEELVPTGGEQGRGLGFEEAFSGSAQDDRHAQ